MTGSKQFSNAQLRTVFSVSDLQSVTKILNTRHVRPPLPIQRSRALSVVASPPSPRSATFFFFIAESLSPRRLTCVARSAGRSRRNSTPTEPTAAAVERIARKQRAPLAVAAAAPAEEKRSRGRDDACELFKPRSARARRREKSVRRTRRVKARTAIRIASPEPVSFAQRVCIVTRAYLFRYLRAFRAFRSRFDRAGCCARAASAPSHDDRACGKTARARQGAKRTKMIIHAYCVHVPGIVRERKRKRKKYRINRRKRGSVNRGRDTCTVY